MKDIYDATDEHKREIIEIENIDLIIRKKDFRPTIKDLVLVRATNIFPTNGIVVPTDITEGSQEKTNHWTLNGANLKGQDFIIIEPFQEQINNPTLANVNEIDTWFNGEVRLSKKATILMSEETFRIMNNESLNFSRQVENLNIALYRGDETLALKMLLYNKNYASFDLNENGFLPADEYGDTIYYINQLKELESIVAIELQKIGREVTYGKTQEYYEDATVTSKSRDLIVNNNRFISDTRKKVEEEHLYIDNINQTFSRMITGLTPIVEGDIELDGECYATTRIGKVRENQEDAVLLVKDKVTPDFRMMVVADGMGGEQKGEIASHIIVSKLKEWFESLNGEEKEKYYKDVASIEESLKAIIQEISFDVDWHLYGMGGATIVCAIIGKNNTIIINVGDSRAYIIKKGKLEQVTIDDAIVQEEFEKGNIPNKDAMRFHRDVAGITQAVGMGLINNIHSIVINNNDYDMLLLFSDGVTDCLSEEDIAVICDKTDRKELAKTIAQKAVEHDSISPDILYEEYVDYNLYVPGGKDNTTVASFLPNKDENER